MTVTGDLRVSPHLTVPAAELTWRFSRSSGPGGQHVNTTDTRVELSFDVARSDALTSTQRARATNGLRSSLVDGVLTVAVSDTRSQGRNREIARDRLAETLAAAIAPPPPKRRATKPTRGSQQRRIDAKSRRSEIKQLRQRPTE